MSYIRIDDNLELSEADVVRCRHCHNEIGHSDNILRNAIWRELAPTLDDHELCEEPGNYVDRDIVTRSAFCPQCLTLLSREIIPKGETFHRALSFD